MKEKEVAKVKWFILNKLNCMGKWAGSHTALRNLFRGLPIKYTSSAQGKRSIRRAIKELINKQFIIAKPSTGEIHVSLNSKKIKEIKEFIYSLR